MDMEIQLATQEIRQAEQILERSVRRLEQYNLISVYRLKDLLLDLGQIRERLENGIDD